MTPRPVKAGLPVPVKSDSHTARTSAAPSWRMPSGAGPVASNTQSSVISAMIASTSPRPNAAVKAAKPACAGPHAASRPKRASRSLCGSPRDGIRGPTAPTER